jgi:hypothetical protein
LVDDDDDDDDNEEEDDDSDDDDDDSDDDDDDDDGGDDGFSLWLKFWSVSRKLVVVLRFSSGLEGGKRSGLVRLGILVTFSPMYGPRGGSWGRPSPLHQLTNCQHASRETHFLICHINARLQYHKKTRIRNRRNKQVKHVSKRRKIYRNAE